MATAKYMCYLFVVVVLAILISTPAESQNTTTELTDSQLNEHSDSNDSLLRDAQWYAQDQGISFEEGVRRVQLMESADELTAKLFANEGETFAGIWIQHQPQFRIKVRFTYHGEQVIRPYIVGGPLEGLVDVLPATANYDELRMAEAKARYLVDGLRIPVESGIEETENNVYINTTNLAYLNTALKAANVSLPEEVKVVEVNELMAPDEDIYGGQALATCTNGLSVVHSSGSTGVTTAGHCADLQSFRGQSLTYQAGRFSGYYDIQWHTTPFVERPWVRDSEGYRVIGDAKGRLEYPKDRLACHFGQGGTSPEYTCGYIRDRSYRPTGDSYSNPEDTFVRVESSGDLADRGDSGGPWYVGGTALGIHSGSNAADRAFYMSITYFNDDGPRDFNLVVHKG